MQTVLTVCEMGMELPPTATSMFADKDVDARRSSSCDGARATGTGMFSLPVDVQHTVRRQVQPVVVAVLHIGGEVDLSFGIGARRKNNGAAAAIVGLRIVGEHRRRYRVAEAVRNAADVGDQLK